MLTPQERLLSALVVGIFFAFMVVLILSTMNKKADDYQKEIEDKDGN